MNVNSATLKETLDRQPEKFSEGKLADIKTQKKKVCEENYEDAPEEVILTKYFLWKELSWVFHYIESTKNKLLEVNPNFERSMTIQSHKKYADSLV